MKKETRTTRLLSKKQGQKVVSLGMIVTLFAPLLLAPIANAEEVPAMQQLIEEPVQTAENSQVVEIQEPEIQDSETIVAEEVVVAEEPIVEVDEIEQPIETTFTEKSLLETELSQIPILPEQTTDETNGVSPELEVADELSSLKEYHEIFGKDIDRTVLEAAYASYTGLNEADYTAESWKQMQDIIGTSAGGWTLWHVLSNYYAEGPNDSLGMDGPEFDADGGLLAILQNVRDSAANAVLSAIGGLVEVPPTPTEDVTYYVMYVDENREEISPTLSKTGKKWEAATEKAITIAGYTLASEPELTLTLGDGLIFKFEYKKDEVTPPIDNKLNLDALKAAIATANPLKEADYTAESWKPFAEAEAKANAEAVLAKAEAQNAKVAFTQTEVDAATKALTDAQVKLIKKSDPTDPSNPTNPTDPKPNPGNAGENGSGSNRNTENAGSEGKDSGNKATIQTAPNSTTPSSDKDGRIGNTVGKEDILPQAGEINTPTTLWGIIFVGIATIGTFIFKRKHSH